MRRIPVVWYLPNLLGYLRIILALVGLSHQHPPHTVAIWLASASLDLVDGILARRLNQCSQFGVLLDIVADNLLRTVMWVAVAARNDHTAVVASVVISVEWTTLVCTQLSAVQSQRHWKQQQQDEDETRPWWIQKVFANGFRSPVGAWCVYGLFFTPLLCCLPTCAAAFNY